MKKLAPALARQPDTEEVKHALDKTQTFADALDQVFKKIAVAELLYMAALSHYDAASGVASDKLRDFTTGLTNDLLSAKCTLMALKVASKQQAK